MLFHLGFGFIWSLPADFLPALSPSSSCPISKFHLCSSLLPSQDFLFFLHSSFHIRDLASSPLVSCLALQSSVFSWMVLKRIAFILASTFLQYQYTSVDRRLCGYILRIYYITLHYITLRFQLSFMASLLIKLSWLLLLGSSLDAFF